MLLDISYLKYFMSKILMDVNESNDDISCKEVYYILNLQCLSHFIVIYVKLSLHLSPYTLDVLLSSMNLPIYI